MDVHNLSALGLYAGIAQDTRMHNPVPTKTWKAEFNES